MILPLKGEELVNGGNRRGVRGLEAQLAAARERVGSVSDPGPARSHHSRSWHLTVVYQAGQSEVAPLERHADPAHVRSDSCHAGRVAGVALKADATPVGQRFESMRGGVLIHAHGGVTPGLDQRKGTIGGIAGERPRRWSIPRRTIDTGPQDQKQQGYARHWGVPRQSSSSILDISRS
jgi:hypothetical protein